MKHPRRKGFWNKYNTKSLRVPKGKEGSDYYHHLLRSKEYHHLADELYKKFKYESTHGQKTINNQMHD